MMYPRILNQVMTVALLAGLLSSCGIKRHKYADPIAKVSEQPDKVLFDRAVNDIEHSRFEIARLTLQTLINTYDSSEYLAKAKLAIADSWFREGGAHGLAQAEAEYKDFELFYPNMPEAAEAQERVCDIHYKQMDKADRDPIHAVRAQDECRQLLLQYPNSKFAPETEQKLRDVQEVLAEGEFAAGYFYHHKGAMPAAANRLTGLVDQYPLYSKADEALWLLADSYERMGDRFEDKAAAAYTRIVKEYPLSVHVDAAKEKLEAMKRPVPQPDPVAYARMKYDLENRNTPGKVGRVLDTFKRAPDVSAAAKGGTPSMTLLRPGIPVSVPQPVSTVASTGSGASTQGAGTNDVSIGVGNNTSLDSRPDARTTPPGSAAAAGNTPAANAGHPASPTNPGLNTPQPLATNHPLTEKDKKRIMKMEQEKAKRNKKAAAEAARKAAKKPAKGQPQAAPAPATAPASSSPAASAAQPQDK